MPRLLRVSPSQNEKNAKPLGSDTTKRRLVLHAFGKALQEELAIEREGMSLLLRKRIAKISRSLRLAADQNS
jgi:hypothetical protein